MHMSLFFFFNDTATTEIYTLSLHDALPISAVPGVAVLHVPGVAALQVRAGADRTARPAGRRRRSEEHTSELQSPCNLVCRLLLEKKKIMDQQNHLRAAGSYERHLRRWSPSQ